MRCCRMEFSFDEEEDYVDYAEDKDSECIYSDEGSASMLDADEVSPEEEAFMRGYMEE